MIGNTAHWTVAVAVMLRDLYHLEDADARAVTLLSEARRQSEESIHPIWTFLDAKYEEIARGDYEP